jgi:hypothetical protein
MDHGTAVVVTYGMDGNCQPAPRGDWLNGGDTLRLTITVDTTMRICTGIIVPRLYALAIPTDSSRVRHLQVQAPRRQYEFELE